MNINTSGGRDEHLMPIHSGLKSISNDILGKVNLLFSKNPDISLIITDLNSIARTIQLNILGFKKDEYYMILGKIKEIELFLTNNEYEEIYMSLEFKKCYEGFYLLKEIEKFLQHKNITINKSKLTGDFSKGLNLEHDRQNIIGLLLSSIKGSIIIDYK